jgi:hypothetical protein
VRRSRARMLLAIVRTLIPSEFKRLASRRLIEPPPGRAREWTAATHRRAHARVDSQP